MPAARLEDANRQLLLVLHRLAPSLPNAAPSQYPAKLDLCALQVDLTCSNLLHQGSLQKCCCTLQVVLSFRAQQTKFQDDMERLKTENVRIQNEAEDKVRDLLQLLALSVVISRFDIVCVQRKAASPVCSLQPAGSAGLLCLPLLDELVGSLREQYAMRPRCLIRLPMVGRHCTCRGTSAALPDLQQVCAAAYIPVRQSSSPQSNQSPDCWKLHNAFWLSHCSSKQWRLPKARAAANCFAGSGGCPPIGLPTHAQAAVTICCHISNPACADVHGVSCFQAAVGSGSCQCSGGCTDASPCS